MANWRMIANEINISQYEKFKDINSKLCKIDIRQENLNIYEFFDQIIRKNILPDKYLSILI